jgi:hypothetical protein
MSEPPLPAVRAAAFIGGLPHGPLFAAIGVAGLALQIAALLAAVVRWQRVRRGGTAAAPPPLSPPIVAGLIIPLVCAAAGGSIHAARTVTMDAFQGRRAPSDAVFGIEAQIAVFPSLATILLAVVLIWIAGLWFTLDARRRAAGRPGASPLPAAMVALGLVPTIVGIWRWRAILNDAFRATAGAPRLPHGAAVVRAVEAAGARLATFARVSTWAVATLAVVALALAIRAHVRRAVPPEPAAAARGPAHASLWASAIALAAAALLFAVTRPMWAENRLPWPPHSTDGRAWTDRTAPDLEGPDEIARAPVVRVGAPARDRPPRSDVSLDGRVVPPASLVDRLWSLRNELARRQPDTSFSGAVVAVISRDAPYDEIVSALRAMHDAGFLHPQFAFTRWESYSRPKLGALKRLRVTGVRVTLVDDMDKEYAEDAQAGILGELVRLSEFDTYEALARRLVDLRRVGQAIVLDLEALK